MVLSYAEMTQALALLNGVEPHGLGAFRARLRKLQAEGVPGDANPGKGKRVHYTFPLILEAAIAVEFLQMGWSPPQAAALIKSHRQDIFLASLLSLRPMHAKPEDVMMMISPEALSSRSLAGQAGVVSFVTREKIAEIFSKGASIDPVTGDIWRWSVIDLSLAVIMMMSCIVVTGTPEDVMTAALDEELRGSASAVEEFCKTRLNAVVEETRGRLDGVDS